MEAPHSLPFRTLRWIGDAKEGFLRIIDQRQLPLRLVTQDLDTAEKVFTAIRTLSVRGAPAIGAAAAYGVLLGARLGHTGQEVRAQAEHTRGYLATCRPTARNLFWALERTVQALLPDLDDRSTLLELLLKEARAIEEEDRRACETIGALLLPLLPEPIRAMTHCNAGALATCGIGTALAPLYRAKWEGRPVKVWAGETRPLLQGARLTAWELSQAGVEVTLLVDSARAHLLRRGEVNCIIVGADRIARNGDTANKIGTYDLALLAAHHGVPFYVAAPTSTFDTALASGDEIVIEQRAPGEITCLPDGTPIAPQGIGCANPAFDVTPASLIRAIITERGVIMPPCEATVASVLSEGT